MPKADDDRGPYLGGLLRLARHAVLARLDAKFAQAGLAQFQRAHYPILQLLHQKPEGARLTELAEKAGMTKQSMGELVDGMERLGYVERVADATDRRARLVRFTEAGENASRLTGAAVRAVEADLAAQMGHERVEALKALLREVVALG